MSANDNEMEKDRRWSFRRGVELDADLTDSAGQSYVAKITNISEEGCMVRILSGEDLVLERMHGIKITGLEMLSAYVIWASDGKAGLCFATPLQSATVQSLVTKSLYARLSRNAARPPVSEEDLGPREPFPFED